MPQRRCAARGRCSTCSPAGCTSWPRRSGSRRRRTAATADALATAVHRHRRLAGLVAAGTVRLRLADGSGVELDRGVLTRVHDADGVASVVPHAEPPPADRLLPSELADEVLAVSRFLDRYADRLRVEHAQHGLASVLPRLPTFAPAPSNAPAAVDRRR